MKFFMALTYRFSIVVLLILSSMASLSQDKEKGFWSGWSLNLNVGPNLAYTDIDNYRFYRTFSNKNEWRIGYGLILQKRVHPLIHIRGQIINGELSGSKRKYDYWFEAKILETSFSSTLDITGLFWGKKDRRITFYGMLGIGLTHWTTDLYRMSTDEKLGGNGHNTGSGLFGRTMETVVPFGLGLDFNVGYHWNINLEGSLRVVSSDVLDAKEGGFQFDLFSYDFVGVTYKFRKRRPKPPVMPPEDLIAEEPELPAPPVPEKIPQEKRVIVSEEQQNLLKLLEERMLEEDSKGGMYESPWQDVEFRVQIAASRTAVDPSHFQKQYNISGDINRTYSNGWYYYSIGSYIKYWRAREYRNILLTRNNVQGAFVVAYKDGERMLLSDLIHYNIDERYGEQYVEKERPASQKAYSVQVMATRDANVSPIAIREMYDVDDDIFKEFDDGWYKYTVGNFESYQQASKLRNKLRMQGLREAFIVGYKDGKRVPLELLNDQ